MSAIHGYAKTAAMSQEMSNTCAGRSQAEVGVCSILPVLVLSGESFYNTIVAGSDCPREFITQRSTRAALSGHFEGTLAVLNIEVMVSDRGRSSSYKLVAKQRDIILPTLPRRNTKCLAEVRCDQRQTMT